MTRALQCSRWRTQRELPDFQGRHSNPKMGGRQLAIAVRIYLNEPVQYRRSAFFRSRIAVLELRLRNGAQVLASLASRGLKTRLRCRRRKMNLAEGLSC